MVVNFISGQKNNLKISSISSHTKKSIFFTQINLDIDYYVNNYIHSVDLCVLSSYHRVTCVISYQGGRVERYLNS